MFRAEFPLTFLLSPNEISLYQRKQIMSCSHQAKS